VKIGFVPFHFPHLCVFAKPLRAILLGYGILLAIIACRLLMVRRQRNNHVAQLGRLTWKRNQFCRGWLITGDTGSGKTSSGINQLVHQVFQNEPKWGGLCIDENGRIITPVLGTGRASQAAWQASTKRPQMVCDRGNRADEL
jgi:hypothetical protein